MATPYVPTDEDRQFVRDQTGNAPGWTDGELSRLISGVTMLAEDGVTIVADRWACAALVLERLRVLRATATDPGQRGDLSSLKTADLGVNWKIDSNAALRALIARYWRMADPLNKKNWRPTRFRTGQVEKGDRHDLVDWPFGANLSTSQVVNGPNPFGLEDTT